LKGLLKFTTKQGFFETVNIALLNIAKTSPKSLQQALQQHSMEEADKMNHIKPEIIAKIKASLKAQHDQ